MDRSYLRRALTGDRRGAGSKRKVEKRVHRGGAEVAEGRGGIRSNNSFI